MNLNFPEYPLQIKSEKNKKWVFDPVRKKYVILQPEEWVRQVLIKHLEALNYPLARTSVERCLPGSKKRYDLVVFDRLGNPLLIAECKAPDVPIAEQSVDQINAYLLHLPAPFALLTNGMHHYFVERTKDQLLNYPQIPPFPTISA